MAKLVVGMCDSQAFVEVLGADPSGLFAHRDNGREAVSRQKISAGACDQQCDRDHDEERAGERFEKFVLMKERLNNDEGGGLLRHGKAADVDTIRAPRKAKRLIRFACSEDRSQRRKQSIMLPLAVTPVLGKPLGEPDQVALRIEDSEDDVWETMFRDCGFYSVVETVGFCGLAHLGIYGAQERVGEFDGLHIAAIAYVLPNDEVGHR